MSTEYNCEKCLCRGVCNVKISPSILFTQGCQYFKDRSKFIELPCKPGETVYRICPVPKNSGCRSCPWEYCDCHDIGYQKDRKNTIREGKAKDYAWIIKRMPYFGKIYFLNHEQAEKELKECEKE